MPAKRRGIHLPRPTSNLIGPYFWVDPALSLGTAVVVLPPMELLSELLFELVSEFDASLFLW